ncbi:MAG TPA: hypothetical protein PKN96_01275 [Flavobacterium sp.]|uniref:hypothetical protein n=1 Tax=Flavobacterium sp. TaxID=239 RepID=UPI002B5B4DE3|nr:hypothetical protein [Flavobacterium sp.]HNP31903.1 hypothetical protein [Flavobacterium sp.]
MMKKTITILFFLISALVFSQEIKLKKGEILVDDKAWLNYDGCGGFSANCSLMLTSNKEEVIYMKFVRVPGVEPITNYNKTGDLTYIEVKFLGVNRSIELENVTFKKIITIIYNSKCINDDGSFDEDKVQRLIEKYGTPCSDRLNKTTTNNNTIIIKEEPSRGSGININLGRH